MEGYQAVKLSNTTSSRDRETVKLHNVCMCFFLLKTSTVQYTTLEDLRRFFKDKDDIRFRHLCVVHACVSGLFYLRIGELGDCERRRGGHDGG